MENWRRRGPTAEQRRVDLFVGIAVAVVALLSLTLTSSAGVFLLGPPPSWPERVCWSIAITLPLAWRRRWPEAVALVISVTFIGGQVRAVPETQLSAGALFAALYTLGAWSRDHRRARRLQLGIIASMFIWLGIAAWTSWHHLTGESFAGASGPVPPVFAVLVNTILINVLFFGFAWFFGETAWIAARREHQLEVQAEQLRQSQAEAGERAVIGERVRIARELHDVVAHHVSVMGVQAAASRRVMDKDPDKARAALAAVEQSARTAVDELRRMLNVLRSTGAGTSAGEAATASIERVEDLLASARDAGLTTEFGVYGDPVPVPDSMSQAVYRIVQEAVTNTIKHSGATILDVRIRYLTDALELDVTDNGHGGPPLPASALLPASSGSLGSSAATPATRGGPASGASTPATRSAPPASGASTPATRSAPPASGASTPATRSAPPASGASSPTSRGGPLSSAVGASSSRGGPLSSGNTVSPARGAPLTSGAVPAARSDHPASSRALPAADTASTAHAGAPPPRDEPASDDGSPGADPTSAAHASLPDSGGGVPAGRAGSPTPGGDKHSSSAMPAPRRKVHGPGDSFAPSRSAVSSSVIGGVAGAGGGLGLIGMRERVAAHEGTLAVGPRTGGGFRVRASFPLARTAVSSP